MTVAETLALIGIKLPTNNQKLITAQRLNDSFGLIGNKLTTLETSISGATAGWTEQSTYEENGATIIRKVIGYVGGVGTLPTSLTDNIGKYNAKAGGFTTDKNLATDYKPQAIPVLKSINQLENNGDILSKGFNTANATILPNGLIRFSGSETIGLFVFPSSDKIRYFVVTKAENISGFPLIGVAGNAGVVEVGKNIIIDAGATSIIVNANNGSVDVGNFYLGENRLNGLDIPLEQKVLRNIIKLSVFDNLPNVVTDNYGIKKLRLVGNGLEQSLSIDLPVSKVGQYASVLFQSSISSLKTRVSYLQNAGDTGGVVNETFTAISPSSKHVLSKYVETVAYPKIRLTVYFTGSSTDWLELSEPAVTEELRKLNNIVKNYDQLEITAIKNNKSVNLLPNGGDIRTYQIFKFDNSLAGEQAVNFFGNSIVDVYTLDIPTTSEYNFVLLEAKNIVGNPKIGFRTANEVIYFTADIGKNFLIPSGVLSIGVNAGAGNSIDISKMYFGENPYNENWVKEDLTQLNNYFQNQDLNGFTQKITDLYGLSKLRLVGNGSEQKIRILFNKININDFFSLIYRCSLNGKVNVRTGFKNESGSEAGSLFSDIINISNTEMVVTRRFEDFPIAFIEVSFTGTTDDYLELYSPAITKENRVLSNVLVDKSIKSTVGGLSIFDSLFSALINNPSGIFQVGRNLFTRKKENPILKTDYSLINSNQQGAKVAKLQAIKYVDLGSWKLMLITTKKRYIFSDNTNIKYTDNLQECLIPSADVNEEKRFTFDASKLTQMFAVLTTGIRELGNGELVIWTYENYNYYTKNNQSTFLQSATYSQAFGNRIDGWAFDAYADTVVFSTYEPAPNRGKGSVVLSIDGGKNYETVFNIENLMYQQYLPDVPLNLLHLHGVFIDEFRESIFLLVGDFTTSSQSKGKILVLKNYKTNRTWEVLPTNFKEGFDEQYCTGFAMEKQILFGTDMAQTCIARLNLSDKEYLAPREVADEIINSLDFIPAFTRPVESGAPIGIYYNYTKGNIPGSIKLTKDGINFLKVYTDTVNHQAFINEFSRVWCFNSGDLFCTQYNGRFTNELILGNYNGFNSI